MKNLKEQGINEILVEDVRLTQIEGNEVKVLHASNAAEMDKAREKIILKLAVMEEMFASGELMMSMKNTTAIPVHFNEIRGEN